jgi:uncharacterized protein YfaS (alpha-2-macroglobulin family)
MQTFGRLLVASALAFAWVTGAVAQQPPQRAFVRDSTQAEALRLEPRLRAEHDPAGRAVPQLVREAEAALQRNDFRAAANAFAAAVVAEPNNVNLLLRLSDTYRRVDAGNNWQLRSELQQRSSAAAYLAYQRARTPADEARALWFLAESFVARSLYRPALDALRIATDTAGTDPMRARYEALLNEHGFRILDYRVDSDAASPRVCFQFSEPLRARLDGRPYVSMPAGIPGAVQADGEQLCVDGLRHGERYEIQVRPGLPSSVGETLRRAADYQIYVRDRTPAVRFTGRNYVLPRVGQQGIPVVSVNLAEVALSVARIGDRSIAPTLLDEDFLATLRGEQARRILQERGTEVWRGTLQVENRLNEEVVTAFPVSEALGERLQPGIYVMVARRADVPEDQDLYEPRATQWFVVSDLGVSTARAADGLHVELRSLATAAPVEAAELRLIGRNNEVLATVRTGADGRASFEAGLVRGEGGMAPGVLVATKDGDYAVLNLTAAAFDLSDRGVTGRPAPGPLDAFVVTERGVYRSGETVHVTALLRDAQGAAAPNLPLTLVLERPDGVEARRMTVEDMGAGGRAWSVPLLRGAMTGTWRVKALVDPRRPPVGQATFLVEDYVPDRLELTLETRDETIAAGRPATIDVAGRWLFGAPATDLALEGETIVSAAPGPPPGLEGFRVGLADEQVLPQRRPIEGLPRTGPDGRARIQLALPDMPSTSRPMQVEALIRLTESSGRGVERRVALRVAERRPWIGVRPLFSSLSEGETASFDIAVLGADGRRAEARGLRWEISSIETRYQWYRVDGRWSFQSVTSGRRVADGTVDASAGELARISARVGWGRYRLDVTAPDGRAATSVAFNVGWEGGEPRADSPDVLELALDKPRYAAGESARVRIVSRFAGQATIQVVNERVHLTRQVELAQGPNTVELPVAADWGAGAYVVATAFRPLDAGARRQPGRAIGLRWLSVDPAPRTLTVALETPDQMQPRRTLRVPVRLTGQEGKEARVTVAAVDVGILNLTNYRAPDPVGYLYGQRALGAELRDIYGFLIDGMQGTRGRIRSGGDGGAELNGSPPAQAPLALFSGVVQVGQDGLATVEFDIPAFAGTVRVMAVAWTADKVGAAQRDVVVRDPVVVSGTLPRFLAAGDRSRFLVEVHNVDGPPGEYVVSLDATGPVILPADALRRAMRLDRGQRVVFSVPVTAAGMGRATFDLSVAGPENVASGQSFVLGLQPATPVIARRSVRPLAANGGALEIGPDLLADVVPGTGAVAVSVGVSAALDVPGLLQQLARYPYGCTEQTVSRAMALMRLSGQVDERALALGEPLADTVRASIERVLLRQSSNGSFGLWGVGGGDLWLDAFVADFLTRAREGGHTVPRVAFDLALERLRNETANANPDSEREGASEALAYALYVLARNGRPVIGDLRYLADAKPDDIATPLGQAQVGAALALLGDRTRAQPMFARAVQSLTDAEADGGRADYGSRLRDGAAILALLAETSGGDRALVQRALALVERFRGERRYLSTQETLWLALAGEATRGAPERQTVEVAGTLYPGRFQGTFRAADLAGGAVTIRNNGGGPLQAVVSVIGAPATPEPAAAQGFQLERSYLGLDGQPRDPRRVRQNERMVVVLRVTEPEPRFGRLLLVDQLPAGFEIDSPALVESARVRGIPGLSEEGSRPVHTEFRDDRFVAAFERQDGATPTFAVAYIVRAVAPGSYSHPGAHIEDMYAPDRFARTAPGTVEVTEQ